MILSFKEQLVQPIIKGTKIHTIRRDPSRRWREGMKIHFWCGSPRSKGRSLEGDIRTAWEHELWFWINRSNRGVSGEVEVGKLGEWWPLCTGVQEMVIRRAKNLNGFEMAIENLHGEIDGMLTTLDDSDAQIVARNDGLSMYRFREWFLPEGVDEFRGRIIHWTEKRY